MPGGIRLPIVTGEALYTNAEFRSVCEQLAADIINPDVCNCGGILALQEIVAMAEPYDVTVSPHNYNSTTLGLAATLQVAAILPNFLITEYCVDFATRAYEVMTTPFQVDNGPGLGVEIRQEVLERSPYRAFPLRGLPTAHAEGP